jgi:hypothetical protein
MLINCIKGFFYCVRVLFRSSQRFECLPVSNLGSSPEKSHMFWLLIKLTKWKAQKTSVNSTKKKRSATIYIESFVYTREAVESREIVFFFPILVLK